MPTLAVPLTFAVLQNRLLRHVRERVANGELTERGLARMIGVSQPHMHNILKGVRALTSDIGDLLIAALGVSLLELAETEELGQALEARGGGQGTGRQVRLVQGQLSPFERFPDPGPADDWVRVPDVLVAAVRRPAIMAYVADIEVEHLFGGVANIILEMDEAARLAVRPECWYAIRWGGAGYVRRLRRNPGALVVLGQRSWRPSNLPDRIPLGDLSALSVIRGRVEWCGPDIRTAAIAQSGSFLSRRMFS